MYSIVNFKIVIFSTLQIYSIWCKMVLYSANRLYLVLNASLFCVVGFAVAEVVVELFKRVDYDRSTLGSTVLGSTEPDREPLLRLNFAIAGPILFLSGLVQTTDVWFTVLNTNYISFSSEFNQIP